MSPQSYEPRFFLLKRRLPASESAHLLGRVVQRYQDPTVDYTPNSPSESVSAEIFNSFLLGVQYDTDAVLKAQASRNDGVRAKLSGLLSFSTASVSGGSTIVESPCIITRRLKRENNYFEALKAIPEIRREILDMCPVGQKVYLIVGTMSAQRARFEHNVTQSKTTSVSGSLKPPLSIALSMGAPHANALTAPEASSRYSDSSEWAMKFCSTAIGEDGVSSEGEEVFAVACKEISRGWGGLGHDVKLKPKSLEYRGGQHYGTEEESDASDEDEADEAKEALAAQGLNLLETEPLGLLDGSWISIGA
ncbi:hypothetical protein L207DRAFT_509254 [Hyaloscypha variabilis F]|uniref:Uncharacterized protein n=1 Tax=Hyaloscypha variabilis (strain UAMH 11265 / GT02V1 / F) TaxID=1149755 RepID=A0A2J6S1A9_HYAVF|nr:hypothetical protein L207DRAFT_509254 [Hyaloscypha variabilis F]